MRGLAFSAVLFGLSLLGTNANADIASAIEIPTEVRVGNEAQTAYIFKLPEGDRANPDIILTRGETYSIVAEFGGAHPFYIRNQSDDANTEGVVGQGVASPGAMTITVTESTPDLLYYVCDFHADMRGNIYVVNAPEAANKSIPLPALGLLLIAGGVLAAGLRRSR